MLMGDSRINDPEHIKAVLHDYETLDITVRDLEKKWGFPRSGFYYRRELWRSSGYKIPTCFIDKKKPGGGVLVQSSIRAQVKQQRPREFFGYNLVLIEWLDAKGLERWEYRDEIEPYLPALCYSTGFLIDDKAEYKTISQGISETQVLGRMTIPTGCIRSIKKIREV